VFGDLLVFHDKIDLVATAGFAVAGKAGPGIGFRVYLQAGGLIIMEGAFQAIVAVGGKVITA